MEKYTYYGGEFVKVKATQWQERQKNRTYKFKETKRDASWIFLYGSSRKIHVCLPIKGGKAYYMYVGNTSWKTLFEVTKSYTSTSLYIKSSEVKKIVTKQLKSKLKKSLSFQIADAEYFCPSIGDVKAILSRTYVDNKFYQWTAQKFDCDDFAIVLKAEFAKDGYKNGSRRAPHCVGIVWGNLPGPHAINWVIDSTKRLWFIEPQNDKIFLPRKADKDIYFLYV